MLFCSLICVHEYSLMRNLPLIISICRNYWGAKNAVLIIDDGEFWRLFTPIFLHAGLIHLGGNVMVQIDAGNTWEKEWGSVIWMIIYIGSAFGSSVLSTICMPDNISVGSSGAVMGLFGAKFSEIVLLCCEKSTNLRERSDERSRKQQAALVIGGIVIVALMSFIPYVDWAAHLGGMVRLKLPNISHLAFAQYLLNSSFVTTAGWICLRTCMLLIQDPQLVLHVTLVSGWCRQLYCSLLNRNDIHVHSSGNKR